MRPSHCLNQNASDQWVRVHERPICDRRLETSIYYKYMILGHITSLADLGDLLKTLDVCVGTVEMTLRLFLGRVGFLVAVPQATTGKSVCV